MTTNQTIDGVLVSRELLEDLCDPVRYIRAVESRAKLRALLDAPYPSEDELNAMGLGYPFSKEEAVQLYYSGFKTEPITVLEAWDAIGHDIGFNPSKEELLDSLRNMAAICDAHGNDMPAAQPLGEPVACSHEWTDDGEFLLVCTACGAQEDYRQALQRAFELGGTDDGNYDLDADELCEVLRLHTEQPAPVAVDETAEFSKWTHQVVAESRIGGVTLKVQRMQHMTLGEEAAAFEAWKYRANLAPLAGIVLPEREALRDIIAQAISGDTYDCTRAWSAWGVGTMSEDDFVSVVDQESRLYEIADACLDEVTRLNPSL